MYFQAGKARPRPGQSAAAAPTGLPIGDVDRTKARHATQEAACTDELGLNRRERQIHRSNKPPQAEQVPIPAWFFLSGFVPVSRWQFLSTRPHRHAQKAPDTTAAKWCDRCAAAAVQARYLRWLRRSPPLP